MERDWVKSLDSAINSQEASWHRVSGVVFELGMDEGAGWRCGSAREIPFDFLESAEEEEGQEDEEEEPREDEEAGAGPKSADVVGGMLIDIF